MFWLGCTLKLGPCLGFCAKVRDRQKQNKTKQNQRFIAEGQGLHPFMTAVDQCCQRSWLGLAVTDTRKSTPGLNMDYWSLKWHSQLMEQFTNQTDEHLVLFGSSRNWKIRKCKVSQRPQWPWLILFGIVFFFFLFFSFQQQLCGNQIALQPKDSKGTTAVVDLLNSGLQSDGTSSEITQTPPPAAVLINQCWRYFSFWN